MSKIRHINKDGVVKFLNKRVAAKTDLLKRKGFWVEEIEKPKAVESVKAPVEAVVVEDVEVPDLNAPTLEELRIKYKEVIGKKPHHTWKEEKLTAKINEKLNG